MGSRCYNNVISSLKETKFIAKCRMCICYRKVWSPVGMSWAERWRPEWVPGAWVLILAFQSLVPILWSSKVAQCPSQPCGPIITFLIFHLKYFEVDFCFLKLKESLQDKCCNSILWIKELRPRDVKWLAYDNIISYFQRQNSKSWILWIWDNPKGCVSGCWKRKLYINVRDRIYMAPSNHGYPHSLFVHWFVTYFLRH